MITPLPPRFIACACGCRSGQDQRCSCGACPRMQDPAYGSGHGGGHGSGCPARNSVVLDPETPAPETEAEGGRHE